MGKKGKWFSAVKKAFGSPSKESSPTSKENSPSQALHKDNINLSETVLRKSTREKRSFGKPANLHESQEEFEPVLSSQEEKHNNKEPNEDVPSDPCLTNGVPCVSSNNNHSTSQEEWAAIKIQTAFRGFSARRTLRVMRGSIRLQSLVHGHTVRKQARVTLKCMQGLVRVQTRIRARRIRMSEETLALQLKRHQEFLASKSLGIDSAEEGWNDSMQTQEEIEIKKLSKQEAALKRERALAYAYSHQLWRSAPANSASSLFISFEADKPHWGWSWLERWMTAGAWENQIYEKDTTTGGGGGAGHSTMATKSTSESITATNSIDKGLTKAPPPPKPMPELENPSPVMVQNPSAVMVLSSPPLIEKGTLADEEQEQPSPAVVVPLDSTVVTTPTTTPTQSSVGLATRRLRKRSGNVTSRSISLPIRDSNDNHNNNDDNIINGKDKDITIDDEDDDDEGSLVSSHAAVPNYMSATKSTRAKARPLSAPKQRLGGRLKRLSLQGVELSSGGGQSGTPRSTRMSSSFLAGSGSLKTKGSSNGQNLLPIVALKGLPDEEEKEEENKEEEKDEDKEDDTLKVVA